MNWRNLVAHDLRCGLLRKRYLAAVGIAAVQCAQCTILLNGYARMGLLPRPGGTWMDYLLFMYMGNPAVKIEGIQNAFNVPIWWLLMVGGCLYLNLDYLLYDCPTPACKSLSAAKRSANGIFPNASGTWPPRRCFS